ncbi:O-methyltransferase family 2 [Penicillium canescens]|nr:O-methyltransferase family 2 [Penicillium canescens]
MAKPASSQLGANSDANKSCHTDGERHANGDAYSNDNSEEAFVNNIAIPANMPELVPIMVRQIASLWEDISLGGHMQHMQRSTLLEAARSLVHALETPVEAVIRYCWSQSTLFVALETGIDVGIFAISSKDEEPKAAAELANDTRADPVLVARILKHLCAMGVIMEAGSNKYRRKGVSMPLAIQRYSDAFPCM